MADTVPLNFPASPPIGIASYDFEDLASGLGYQTYYAVVQNFPPSALAPYVTANPQYFLLDSNSLDIYTEATTTSTSTSATLNFDTSPFKISRLVTGKVFINFAFKGHSTSTNCTFSAQLFKYNGSAETAITVLQTQDYNGNNSPAVVLGANSKGNFMASITATDTIVSAGEQLRLKVIVTDFDSEVVTVYHDPLGRDLLSDVNFSTRMKVKVPFKND